MKTILKWGLLIGLANLIWLYVAFYLGLHTSGIKIFQIFMLGWLAITVTGFILGLRAVRRQNPALGYLSGLGAGILMAVVTAVVAVIAQVGYFKAVHPAWPEVMAKQTEEHFTKLGMKPDEVAKMVEESRVAFSLENYAAASAVIALVTGIVLSGIIMIFLRRRSPAVATLS